MAYAHDSHERLVESVKKQQRSSDIAREGWRHYCAALGNGIQDPAKHTSQFLEDFLDVLQANQIPRQVSISFPASPLFG